VLSSPLHYFRALPAALGLHLWRRRHHCLSSGHRMLCAI